jgi:hypothetical protein
MKFKLLLFAGLVLLLPDLAMILVLFFGLYFSLSHSLLAPLTGFSPLVNGLLVFFLFMMLLRFRRYLKQRVKANSIIIKAGQICRLKQGRAVAVVEVRYLDQERLVLNFIMFDTIGKQYSKGTIRSKIPQGRFTLFPALFDSWPYSLKAKKTASGVKVYFRRETSVPIRRPQPV